ncbi:hypothetical protein BDV25DRAFT_147265 [Aspergillus avenaceus]|uniref:Uncharacterized protein n=1 Tax=Aspergillus avenaceus TaxID=36643 RepID=A0A5N6U7S0_ASPAV|nr:hypothetical protein BDV25DRAFT_147265 [Aspergillus avenaceus]
MKTKPTPPSPNKMPVSESRILRLTASAFATICVSFGINAILRPEHALTFFEFNYPTSSNERAVVDSLMVVYGARDIFMGLAVYIALLFGSSKSVGWMLIAVSAVAMVDGFVCWGHGKGEWNHWGYAPVIAGVGAVALGGLDR